MIKGLGLALILFFIISSFIIVVKPVSSESVFNNSWVKKTNTPQGRAIWGIAVVNGKIYAFGVYQYNQTSYATTGEYDPSTDTWTTKSPMRQPRTNFATIVYKDKIYLIGGQNGVWYSPALRTVEVYDPINDVWSYSTPMPEPKASISANLVNGKIYVIGGTTNPIPTKLDEGITNTTQVYDPNTSQWSTAAAIPEALCNYASAVFEGKIFTFGGRGISITPTTNRIRTSFRVDIVETNSTHIYDPETNVWTFGKQLPYRLAGAAACVATGEFATKGIYLFGGYNNFNDYDIDERLTLVYDPANDRWINGTRIPEYPGHTRASPKRHHVCYGRNEYSADPNLWKRI